MTSAAEQYRAKAEKAMMPLHTLTFATWQHASLLFEADRLSAEDYAALLDEIVACMAAQVIAPTRLFGPDLKLQIWEKVLTALKESIADQASKDNLIVTLETSIRPRLQLPS